MLPFLPRVPGAQAGLGLSWLFASHCCLLKAHPPLVTCSKSPSLAPTQNHAYQKGLYHGLLAIRLHCVLGAQILRHPLANLPCSQMGRGALDEGAKQEVTLAVVS